MQKKLRDFTLAVCVLALPAGAGVAAQNPSTLALEGGTTSLSSGWSGESPPGTSLDHRGTVDGSEPTFGLSFEYRATRWVGIRAGLLQTSVPVRATMVCPDGPCTFTVGPQQVSFSEGEFAVDEDSDLQSFFVEVPFVVTAGERTELFGGPTLALLDIEDVERVTPDGLAVDLGVQSPSYGLHLGAAVHLGWKQRPGARSAFSPWSLGLVARWIRTELDATVRHPNIAGLDLLTADSEEDLVSVTLVLGRRIGGD